MTFELPLFPLGVVLFPGMPLPLHIFEPRYRAMIGRCIETDSVFGVALLVEGEDGEASPAVIGCTAEITDTLLLPDGRYNLQTLGRRRFRLVSVREEIDEYLIGTAEWLDDEEPEDAADVLSSQALRALRRYLGLIGANIDISGQEEWNIPADPLGISMWIAALLAAPDAQKQRLLETTSTTERLRMEISLLRRAEVVQRAFTMRSSWPEPNFFDEANQRFAPFLSLN